MANEKEEKLREELRETKKEIAGDLRCAMHRLNTPLMKSCSEAARHQVMFFFFLNVNTQGDSRKSKKQIGGSGEYAYFRMAAKGF